MSETKMERLPISEWQAHTLRLTLFPSPAARIDKDNYQNWWEELVGEPPAQVVSQPRTGTYQAGGPFVQDKLVLGIDPIGINWVYTVLDNPDTLFQSVGTFEESRDLFHELANRWFALDSAPKAVRIAFGAVLLAPVNSIEAGHRQLSPYLPFELDTGDTSDFLYQINRRRDSRSGIENLRINRLSKWSVAVLAQARFLLSSGMGQAQLIGSPVYACRLELDISTVSEFEGELGSHEQTAVFEELIELGTEIVQKGDIP